MDSVRALGYPTLQPDHVPWVLEMPEAADPG